ncbi:putative polyamine oxidase [Lachnellula subtilissima]|uniref:Putative polyamine oxidase n=1 Tax=Lachnellula subtilissima TaxID=602034 RepID=A0A8H8U6S6_9HELO|nr:putative polyamine oxidase [Lachnellula subtilissima]
MDAYSISYTTPSRRGSSRIYQDLATCRLASRRVSTTQVEQLDMEYSKKLRRPNHSQPPRIGIVGAGISGLRCADVLLQHGFSVTILEGRNRIGGRMHQTTLSSGQLIDVGPNWIHGTDNNPILDLAKETNTPTHTWEEQTSIFDETGKALKDGNPLMEAMWGIIVEAFKHSGKNTAEIDPEESLYDFFINKSRDVFTGQDDAGQQRKILLQMAELWGAFVGSPVQRQSLKYFWLEECIDGENLFCAGTYQKILALIAKPALDNAEIKLSTKINKFETQNDIVTVTVENGQFEFDEVVVTAPLGWLKVNKPAFHPPLSERLSQAIDSIGYGNLDKVYITFPRAFWLGDKDKAEDQFSGFIHWMSPVYASDTNPQKWNQEAVDMNTLPKSCSHPTLLFYFYGDQSLKLAKDLAALPSETEKHDYLVQFFKPYYSRLPHYKKGSKDCIPVSSLATNWVLDELAGNGSYSTFRTGLREGDKDIEVMREGLPSRSLWFAGEHTAPFVALGTVTGAYWSGEAVGKRIADAYGMGGGSGKDGFLLPGKASTEGAKEVNVRGFADKALEK